MVGILDVGTTNTKLYFVECGQVVFQQHSKKGIKDFSSGGGVALEQFIQELLQTALTACAIQPVRLNKVILFGMITSELGLVERKHCVAPVAFSDLRKAVYRLQNHTILPETTELLLIPGVRLAHGTMEHIESVLGCDFMRGEETQSFGVLQKYQPTLPVGILFLTSHTKLVCINAAGQIENSVTTMSGQLFEALSNHTIIGRSVRCDNEEIAESCLLPMLTLAEQSLTQSGFIRSILIPRFMEVFTTLADYERRVFFEALIALEDMKSMEQAFSGTAGQMQQYYIVGQSLRSRIYEMALRRRLPESLSITCLTTQEQLQEITVAGAMLVAGES